MNYFAKFHSFIGASLSEPHIDHDNDPCTCMYLCTYLPRVCRTLVLEIHVRPKIFFTFRAQVRNFPRNRVILVFFHVWIYTHNRIILVFFRVMATCSDSDEFSSALVLPSLTHNLHRQKIQ